MRHSQSGNKKHCGGNIVIFSAHTGHASGANHSSKDLASFEERIAVTILKEWVVFCFGDRGHLMLFESRMFAVTCNVPGDRRFQGQMTFESVAAISAAKLNAGWVTKLATISIP